MKEKTKIIISVIITFIITISITVTASIVMNATDISFTSDKTDKTNVKDSLDELYEMAENQSSMPVSGLCDSVAAPNLGTNKSLIPVVIKDDGTVIKVSETDSNWYNYCNRKWANAVILNTTDTYKIGATIPSSSINSYFVWIPKYKYKLWNVGTTDENVGSHSIGIVFDTTNTTDVEGESCATPLISGESGNCNNGEYMTHPAFITMGVNGFWVGKFETRNLETAIEIDGNNTNIQVVPNVSYFKTTNITTKFENAYNYNRTLNSHMMKNTEWGAVAYLSHSIYGINKEVNINNNNSNSSSLTGYSSYPDKTTTYGNGGSINAPYNTEVGYLASTTGNISGIYDMNGGIGEYMASHVQGRYCGTWAGDCSDATKLRNYDAKYFDIYNEASDSYTFQNRILGDAIGEMGPASGKKWLGSSGQFLYNDYPWSTRGSYFTNGRFYPSQFSFDNGSGGGSNHSFRLVLAP